MARKVWLYRDPPTEESLEIARNELRETPEVVKESMAKLRELLKGEPNLYFSDEEAVLKVFLRPCKFYPESAFALMKRVADFKVTYASTVKGLMPEHEEKSMMEHNAVNVLSHMDHLGRRILVLNIGKLWDTKHLSGDQFFRLLYLVHIGAMLEPETQIRGAIVILDFDGLGMRQVAALTPSFSLRLLNFLQDATPMRIKEVHIVKQPYLFNIVWKVFQPIVREKLRKRLFFHGSKMESLHKFLDPGSIPANYGGKLPEIDYGGADWYPVLREVDDFIKEFNSWGWKNK